MATVWNLVHLVGILTLLQGEYYYVTCAKGKDKVADNNIKIDEDINWSGFPELGQVSGLAVDGDGNLHIFHRGDRIWEQDSFDDDFLLKNNEGPIVNNTVLIVDPTTQKIIHSWGANRFYMPHGMTVDKKGNSWVTDVALHQVMKFPAREDEPTLTLGEAFVPSGGKSHFCQPTDVAISDTGNIFVSDGYCNSRIVMFSRTGHFLKEIGAKDGLSIPHSLVIIPQFGSVCVADRENWRLMCYSTGVDGKPAGELLAKIEGEGIGRVFAVDRRGSFLFAINGPDFWETASSPASNYGVVIDIGGRRPSSLWGPGDKGFSGPHDVAVAPDGKSVYVSEIQVDAPKRVYRFKVQS